VADILVVGSVNMDLVVAARRLPEPGETIMGGRFETFPGGKGANQAVAASRAGSRVAFLGQVGSDDFGAELRRVLVNEGIDCSGLSSVDGPTGVALIMTGAAGQNMIVVSPGSNGSLGSAMIDEALFDGVSIVLAQLETPIDGVIRAAEIAQKRGAIFILDPAPARAVPHQLYQNVNWLTPNESEASTLLGSLAHNRLKDQRIAEELLRLGVRGVVLKLGDRGVVLATQSGGEPIVVPAHPVETVDTTAAGDAFNGAFATALCEGAEPLEAARFAVAASALSVTRRGAQPSMATRSEISDFVAQRQDTAGDGQ
jgi:ribokinase